MAGTGSVQNESLLVAALEGLEVQKKRIEDQIVEVRAMLGKGKRGAAAAPAESKRVAKRTLSEAARKRIAAEQKRRWAEYRKSASAKEN